MWAKTKSGFTIIELLIVIVVIAILAAITIVAFNGIQARAQLASLQSETHSNVNKLELFKTDNDVYPSSITDCPSPAVNNLCLKPATNETYSYQANVPGGAGYMINLIPSYEFSILGSSQFLYTSSAEKTGGNEFMQYVDLAPIIDTYGLKRYQISFDIKSADTTAKSTVNVYFQNGSTTRYGGLSTNVSVTTSYSRKVVTFTAALNNSAVAAAMLAFYGTYGTANIPSVKNVQIQLAP